jgi:predicted nuclease with TOPRIM domain
LEIDSLKEVQQQQLEMNKLSSLLTRKQQEEINQLKSRITELEGEGGGGTGQDDPEVVCTSTIPKQMAAVRGSAHHLAQEVSALVKVKEEYHECQEDLLDAQDTNTFSALAIDNHQSHVECLKAQVKELGGKPCDQPR